METGIFISKAHRAESLQAKRSWDLWWDPQPKPHHCQLPALGNGDPRPPAHCSASPLALSSDHPPATCSAQHLSPLAAQPGPSPAPAWGEGRCLQLSCKAGEDIKGSKPLTRPCPALAPLPPLQFASWKIMSVGLQPRLLAQLHGAAQLPCARGWLRREHKVLLCPGTGAFFPSFP